LKGEEYWTKKNGPNDEETHILIGASHARRCLVQPTRNLGNLFEVTGYVKTGMSRCNHKHNNRKS